MISGRLEKGLAMGYQLASVGLQPGARVAPSHAPPSSPPRPSPTGFLKNGIHRKGFVGDQGVGPSIQAERPEGTERALTAPGTSCREGAEPAGPRAPRHAHGSAPAEPPSPSSPSI